MQPLLVAQDLDRLVGQREPPRVVRRDDAGVVDRLHEQARQVDGLADQGPAGVEPGEQQQVLHQVGHPRGLALDLVQRGGPGLGLAPGELGVAGDGRQRGPQLVAGVRDELADLLLAAVPDRKARLDVVEQGVERGPHLAHLVALVGQSLRHPVGEVDLALGERLLGDPVGGGGDLAQRRELAAYDDRADQRGRPDAEQGEQRLPAHERLEDLAGVAGRQAGHRGEAAVLGDDAVLPEPGELDVVGVAVGGDRGQHGDDARVEGLLGAEAAVAAVGEEDPGAGGAVDPGADRPEALADAARPVVVLSAGVVPFLVPFLVPVVVEARRRRAVRQVERGPHVLVEAVVEVGAHRQRGGERDEHRDDRDQGDRGQHQPLGERPHGADPEEADP